MSSSFKTPRDLTRWNRAGLARLRYLDGDAASWLEELRLGHMAMFLRGARPELRDADAWRDAFSRDIAPPARAALTDEALAALVWTELWRDFPDEPETATHRNARLMRDYRARPGDQTSEIARAFARALHVLLGHADAYANEGYLRTASQWDNVRKLATTVGYAPAPPASAATWVALEAKDGAGTTTVERGLAAKHAPATGPALVFETLAETVVHPGLNVLHAAGWDRDEEAKPIADLAWRTPDGGLPGDGAVALVADESKPDGIVGPLVYGDGPTEGTFAVVDATEVVPAATTLYLEAGKPRRGMITQAAPGQFIAVLAQAMATLAVGAVVKLAVQGDATDRYGRIEAIDGQTLVLTPDAAGPPQDNDAVDIMPLIRAEIVDDAVTVADNAFTAAVFVKDGELIPDTVAEDGKLEDEDGNLTVAADVYTHGAKDAEDAYLVPAAEPEPIPGRVSDVGVEGAPVAEVVTFPGAPPKTLKAGAWMAAHGNGEWRALKVLSVTEHEDRHEVRFHLAPPAHAHECLFHGPFKTAIRPNDHDRSPTPAFESRGLRLALDKTKDADALGLLRRGRSVIVESERDGGPAPTRLTVLGVSYDEDDADTPVLSFQETDAALDGYLAGWTVVRGNCARMGHGETRGPKVLGSGNGEKPRQSFVLDVKGISHVSDPTAEAGVAPDVEITVGGVAWSRADSLDTTAEGANAYSPVLREDGTLRIDFRRRLPTGRDNVVLRRHRVGTGAGGNNVPPNSLKKPMKPHPVIEAIHQPFTTSGGGDAEAASSMRANAPDHLRALGRAVSLDDFAILARRTPGIAQALAATRTTTGWRDEVAVTVVPVGGGTLEGGAELDIAKALETKAMPGVRVVVSAFSAVHVRIDATIRVDVERYIPEDVRAAAEAALHAAFGLDARELGQTLYATEILAVLERVEGVENAKAALRQPEERWTADDGPAQTVPPLGDEPDEADTPLRAVVVADHQVAFLRGIEESDAKGGLSIEIEEITR